MIATEDVSAALDLNQPHVHIVNFRKLYIIFTLVLEKDTALVQFCVELSNGSNVPFVIKMRIPFSQPDDLSHIFLKQSILVDTSYIRGGNIFHKPQTLK